jgi:hypothetical protein
MGFGGSQGVSSPIELGTFVNHTQDVANDDVPLLGMDGGRM